MKTKKLFSGFTLIELLVVIAIIGILSAVVLSSLNTARVRANDTSVKANLSSIGTQAEVYNTNNGQYAPSAIANTCAGGLFDDPSISGAIASAQTANGGTALTCYADKDGYAVASKRPDTSNSTYWCTDNNGQRCGINSLTSLTTYTCGTCVTSE
jgi:prepilin-type N-terminal cleavage/methylation domain-containing protein